MVVLLSLHLIRQMKMIWTTVKMIPNDDSDDTYVAETKNWARGVMVAALVLETSPERGESSSLSEPTIFK